jgi:hypothetical protein
MMSVLRPRIRAAVSPSSVPRLTDIIEAIECHALDKNTGCIFHLMRASEHGLRRLHVKLRDKSAYQPLELATRDMMTTNTGLLSLIINHRLREYILGQELHDACHHRGCIWHGQS